nr:MAG TPA: hypothetical protein [Caudoviricetes sp.]
MVITSSKEYTASSTRASLISLKKHTNPQKSNLVTRASP